MKSRLLTSLVFAFTAVLATSCNTAPGCASCKTTQSVVDHVAKAHPEVTRLSVHCGTETNAKICASTESARIGKASAKEDLEALRTGKTVVLEEGGALDVTIPIRQKDGKFQSTCGVTLKNANASREQLVGQAAEVAKAVEAGLVSCGECCCK